MRSSIHFTAEFTINRNKRWTMTWGNNACWTYIKLEEFKAMPIKRFGDPRLDDLLRGLGIR